MKYFSRRELAKIRRRLPRQPLTPIACTVCGWDGNGAICKSKYCLLEMQKEAKTTV